MTDDYGIVKKAVESIDGIDALSDEEYSRYTALKNDLPTPVRKAVAGGIDTLSDSEYGEYGDWKTWSTGDNTLVIEQGVSPTKKSTVEMRFGGAPTLASYQAPESTAPTPTPAMQPPAPLDRKAIAEQLNRRLPESLHIDLEGDLKTQSVKLRKASEVLKKSQGKEVALSALALMNLTDDKALRDYIDNPALGSVLKSTIRISDEEKMLRPASEVDLGTSLLPDYTATIEEYIQRGEDLSVMDRARLLADLASDITGIPGNVLHGVTWLAAQGNAGASRASLAQIMSQRRIDASGGKQLLIYLTDPLAYAGGVAAREALFKVAEIARGGGRIRYTLRGAEAARKMMYGAADEITGAMPLAGRIEEQGASNIERLTAEARSRYAAGASMPKGLKITNAAMDKAAATATTGGIRAAGTVLPSQKVVNQVARDLFEFAPMTAKEAAYFTAEGSPEQGLGVALSSVVGIGLARALRRGAQKIIGNLGEESSTGLYSAINEGSNQEVARQYAKRGLLKDFLETRATGGEAGRVQRTISDEINRLGAQLRSLTAKEPSLDLNAAFAEMDDYLAKQVKTKFSPQEYTALENAVNRLKEGFKVPDKVTKTTTEGALPKVLVTEKTAPVMGMRQDIKKILGSGSIIPSRRWVTVEPKDATPVMRKSGLKEPVVTGQNAQGEDIVKMSPVMAPSQNIRFVQKSTPEKVVDKGVAFEPKGAPYTDVSVPGESYQTYKAAAGPGVPVTTVETTPSGKYAGSMAAIQAEKSDIGKVAFGKDAVPGKQHFAKLYGVLKESLNSPELSGISGKDAVAYREIMAEMAKAYQHLEPLEPYFERNLLSAVERGMASDKMDRAVGEAFRAKKIPTAVSLYDTQEFVRQLLTKYRGGVPPTEAQMAPFAVWNNQVREQTLSALRGRSRFAESLQSLLVQSGRRLEDLPLSAFGRLAWALSKMAAQPGTSLPTKFSAFAPRLAFEAMTGESAPDEQVMEGTPKEPTNVGRMLTQAKDEAKAAVGEEAGKAVEAGKAAILGLLSQPAPDGWTPNVKDGSVDSGRISQKMRKAAQVIQDDIGKEYGVLWNSFNDSKVHTPGSAHYSGNAGDISVIGKTKAQIDDLVARIKQRFGENAYVNFEPKSPINSGDHIHFELKGQP